MSRILYLITYTLLWLINLLPLAVLYRLSDLCFVLVFWVFRYRRKVVSENLSKAFPEKTAKERRRIERRFYLHLCDYFIETMKMMHISEKEIKRRVQFTDDYLEKRFAENKNIVVAIGHNANWEWLTSIALRGKHHWAVPYHPLQNSPDFDNFMLKLRSRFGATPVPMTKTYKHLMETSRSGKLYVAGMIADQSPPNPKNRHWITFMNQDTAVMEGSERIARKTNADMVFFKMIKIKRGYYKVEAIPMTSNISEEPEFSMTKKYFDLLEEQIREQPEYWLWSHRRWKRKRPTDERLVKA